MPLAFSKFSPRIIRLVLVTFAVVAIGACWQVDAETKSRRRGDPFRAAREGDLERVRALVEQDPSVIQQSRVQGVTPIFYAAEGDQPEVIEYLVSQGADVNARGSSGYTPLMWAAQHALKSPVAAVKTLVRLGADLRARAVTPGGSGKFKGPNALSIAARGGRLDLVKYLLEQGVPVRYGEGDDEETALHHAVVAFVNANRLEEHLAIIDLLIKELDGDVSDTLPFKFDRHTPLWIAAEHGNVEIVRHLLEKYPAIGIDEMRTTVDYLKADKSRPKQAEALALIRGTLKSRIEARDAEFLKQRAQSRPTEDAGGGGKPVLKRSLMTGSR